MAATQNCELHASQRDGTLHCLVVHILCTHPHTSSVWLVGIYVYAATANVYMYKMNIGMRWWQTNAGTWTLTTGQLSPSWREPWTVFLLNVKNNYQWIWSMSYTNSRREVIKWCTCMANMITKFYCGHLQLFHVCTILYSLVLASCYMYILCTAAAIEPDFDNIRTYYCQLYTHKILTCKCRYCFLQTGFIICHVYQVYDIVQFVRTQSI